MSVLWELYGFVMSDYHKFIGTGGYMALYIAAMIYLYRYEKNKSLNAVFIWTSVIIFAIFFNPCVILLVYRQYLWGTYWRMLWLIPAVPAIAYVGTKLYENCTKFRQKLLAVLVLVAVLVTAGKSIYTDNFFQKKPNFFKIPTEAIDISQKVLLYAGEWYPTIIVPNELYCYIRQYTSEIRLLYGRDAEGYMGGVDDEIKSVYLEMSSPNPNCEVIGRVAKEYHVKMVIFNQSFHNLPDPDTMKNYGLYYGGPSGNYVFYVLNYD